MIFLFYYYIYNRIGRYKELTIDLLGAGSGAYISVIMLTLTYTKTFWCNANWTAPIRKRRCHRNFHTKTSKILIKANARFKEAAHHRRRSELRGAFTRRVARLLRHTSGVRVRRCGGRGGRAEPIPASYWAPPTPSPAHKVAYRSHARLHFISAPSICIKFFLFQITDKFVRDCFLCGLPNALKIR